MMEYLKVILKVFESIDSEKNEIGNLFPTELYNETWMLRLVLYWFNKDENKEKSFPGIPISIKTNSSWLSEGSLAPKFKGETHTKADGVYGNIKVGVNGYSNVTLAPGCKQFVVTESKMFSKYSSGTKNYSGYNQAARNIVCMCNIAAHEMHNIDDIAFFTLLPQSQLDKKKETFTVFTNKEHINKTVEDRIEKYKDDSQYEKLDTWHKSIFTPFLNKMEIKLITWEDVIRTICSNELESEPDYGRLLNEYYEKCLIHNQRNNNKSTGKKTSKNGDRHDRGVQLIYCKELFPNTCVHFSWKGSSCKIREYISEDKMLTHSVFSTDEIRDKKPEVKKEYKNSEREKADNTKWWYSEIQKFNNIVGC